MTVAYPINFEPINAGDAMAMSGKCVPPEYGSLTI
jgi:hypothetical protein